MSCNLPLSEIWPKCMYVLYILQFSMPSIPEIHSRYMKSMSEGYTFTLSDILRSRISCIYVGDVRNRFAVVSLPVFSHFKTLIIPNDHNDSNIRNRFALSFIKIRISFLPANLPQNHSFFFPDRIKYLQPIINPQQRRYDMTDLRQKMIRAMELKNLSDNTQRAYLADVTGIASYYNQSPEKLTK